MASCVRNIRTKNDLNLIISFQVTAKNVREVFLGLSVYRPITRLLLEISARSLSTRRVLELGHRMLPMKFCRDLFWLPWQRNLGQNGL